jgi:hypothetical protein
MLGVVMHACSPSYSGDGDKEDHGLKGNPAKKLGGHWSQKQAGHGSNSVIPAT